MKTNLPAKSDTVYATDPSIEFPYTWIEQNNEDAGMFFRTYEEAYNDANDNFHDFSEIMRGRVVFVVKVKDKLQYRG